MTVRTRSELVVLCGLALGGCSGSGGDGGGGADPAVFTGFSQIGPNDTVTVRGEAVVAGFTYDEATGRGTLTTVVREPAEFVGVYEDGELVAVRGRSGDTSFDVDRRRGGVIDSDGTTVFAENDGAQTGVFYYAPSVGGFEYQNFGTWTQGNASGRIATASVGLPTAASDLPGATATYSGFAIGYSARDGVLYYTEANAAVRTDFATATLTTTDTVKVSLETDIASEARDHDLTGTLQVTGSGLSGTVTGGMGSGTASGSFYGPRAAEVGGTFEVSGDGVYTGAFGARR